MSEKSPGREIGELVALATIGDGILRETDEHRIMKVAAKHGLTPAETHIAVEAALAALGARRAGALPVAPPAPVESVPASAPVAPPPRILAVPALEVEEVVVAEVVHEAPAPPPEPAPAPPPKPRATPTFMDTAALDAIPRSFMDEVAHPDPVEEAVEPAAAGAAPPPREESARPAPPPLPQTPPPLVLPAAPAPALAPPPAPFLPLELPAPLALPAEVVAALDPPISLAQPPEKPVPTDTALKETISKRLRRLDRPPEGGRGSGRYALPPRPPQPGSSDEAIVAELVSAPVPAPAPARAPTPRPADERPLTESGVGVVAELVEPGPSVPRPGTGRYPTNAPVACACCLAQIPGHDLRDGRAERLATGIAHCRACFSKLRAGLICATCYGALGRAELTDGRALPIGDRAYHARCVSEKKK